MSNEKSMADADVQHVVTGSDAASDRAAVLTTSDEAAQFEARQHAMTRMEEIKENWRSLLWCEYPNIGDCSFSSLSREASAV